jgi:phosphoglucosamine mutase
LERTGCEVASATAPITPEFVMHLGHAAGKVLAQGSRGRPAVILGKDTRISGYMLESALMAGFCAAGVDVHVTGPLPTPAIAYLTRALRLSAGVVLSASHNPFEDNGIKFFSADGNKLPDETEEAIEALLDEPIVCVTSERLGKAFRVEAAAGRYIEFCKSTFPFALDLKGLKVVVDCAHGASYHTAPTSSMSLVRKSSRSGPSPTARTSMTEWGRFTRRRWRPRSGTPAQTSESLLTAMPTVWSCVTDRAGPMTAMSCFIFSSATACGRARWRAWWEP